MSVAESYELKTFDEFYDRLEDCISADDVTGGCFAKGIISYKERDVVQAASPTFKKNAELLSAVRKSILLKPSNFDTFLSILSKEKKYMVIVGEMSKLFCVLS